MAGRQAYGNKRIFSLSLAAIMAAMSLASALPSHSLLLLLTSAVSVLMLISLSFSSKQELSLFLSLAFATFFSSLSLYTLALLPIYVATIFKLYEPEGYLESRELYSQSTLGPSAAKLLRALLFLFPASLISYKLALSIIMLLLFVLLATVLKYRNLSKVVITSVEHPRRTYVGKDIAVNVTCNSEVGAVLAAIVGDRSFAKSIEHVGALSIALPASTAGRFSYVLRLYAYDKRLFAKRLLLERQISYTVLPSYVEEYEVYKQKRPEIGKELSQPVETKVYILEERGFYRSAGREELQVALSALPGFMRRLIEKLLSSREEALSAELYAREPGEGEGEAKKSDYGEYFASRPFAPGDSLRRIHWKKTASLQKLVAKEFVSGGKSYISSSTAKYGPAIVADLTSSSNLELDILLKKLFRVLVQASLASPEMELSLILAYGKVSIFISGRAQNLLENLYNSLIGIVPAALYSYESFGEPLSKENVEELLSSSKQYSFIRAIAYSNASYAEAIGELMIKNSIYPPRPVALLYGRATAMKSSFLSYYLEKSGYRMITAPE